MSLYLYDGATPWDTSRLASAKAHGGIAVSVYIVGSPGGMRHASAADVALARSMGLGVLPNWERASDFFRTASTADCKAAGAEALAACRALGIPDDGSVAVAFSFDYQVPTSSYAQALAQLQACRDGMGGHYRAIGYAQTGLVEYFTAHGLPGPHWLMGSTWRASSAFAQSEVASPAVALVQSHTASGAWLNSPVAGTDINTITQPSRLAAWWPDGSPYGAQMPLTQTDANLILHTPIRNPFTGQYQPFYDFVVGAYVDAVGAKSAANSVAAGVADAVTRIADLQAKTAALAAELDAVKAQQGNVQIQPADVPVTGTVHIGSTS